MPRRGIERLSEKLLLDPHGINNDVLSQLLAAAVVVTFIRDRHLAASRNGHKIDRHRSPCSLPTTNIV